MSISAQDIQRIAHLARLSVDDSELPEVTAKLTGILGLIEEMQAVNTEGIEPMAHAQDVALRLRIDAVTESDQRARFQAVAPQTENGLYLVPKVLD